MKRIFLYSIYFLIFSSCGEYEKLLKSKNVNEKYKYAIAYFNKKEYGKSLRLLEQIKPLYRGTVKAQTMDYYYAFCLYNQERYLSAAVQFEAFQRFYPESSYIEECLFMQGVCLFKDAPKPTLDQGITYKAKDVFQLYLNRYPTSSRITEIHKYIDELDNKLAYKSFLSGKGYFRREDYNAAIISLQNTLKDFPDTLHREEISFMLLQSRYLLAKNSVSEKKIDRLNVAKEEYLSFIDEYPESDYKKMADNLLKETDKFLK